MHSKAGECSEQQKVKALQQLKASNRLALPKICSDTVQSGDCVRPQARSRQEGRKRRAMDVAYALSSRSSSS